MSCNSSDSDNACCGRSVLGMFILLLVGLFLVANSKEIARYIKISTM